MTPRRAAPLAVLAAALAIGAGWYLIIFKSEPAITKPYPIEFQEYSSNLYRQGFLWKVPLPPAFPVIDVHVFLIKSGQDYILVDVGAPGEEYERIIAAGLQEALKGGKLRNVICEPTPLGALAQCHFLLASFNFAHERSHQQYHTTVRSIILLKES